MDWENLRHFSAFAQHKSLAGAARALGVEHATIGRRIAALEVDLQVKLVDRRGRRLSLTPEGERIAGIAEHMEADAASISRTVAAARADLNGTVTISAPPTLAAAWVVAPLAALQLRHPNLEIVLIGESRQAALERREADIAVRLSRPEEGDLTIVKLAEMVFSFYAAPAYLDAVAPPEWRFIGFDAPMALAPQQIKLQEIAAGRPIAFRASTVDIQLAVTKAGAGIAILPEFMAEGDPALTRAHPGVFRRDVWLAVHSDMKAAPTIRAVIDALHDELANRT